MERVLKRFIAFFTVFAIVMTLAGCGEKKKIEETVDINGEQVSFESKMTIFTHKPDTLCPLLSSSETNIQMLQIVFDSLVGLSPNLLPEPCLAERWSVSDDGKH